MATLRQPHPRGHMLILDGRTKVPREAASNGRSCAGDRREAERSDGPRRSAWCGGGGGKEEARDEGRGGERGRSQSEREGGQTQTEPVT